MDYGREDFQKFYEDTYDMLKSYVRRKCELVDEAEDVVQETYLVTYRKWEDGLLENHPSLLGFLYTTAAYIMQNMRRRADRRVLSLDVVEEFEPGAVAVEYNQVEVDSVLEDIMTEDERKLYELFYEQGYKTAEIARILKIKEDNVRTRLARMRKKIRSKLEEGQ